MTAPPTLDEVLARVLAAADAGDPAGPASWAARYPQFRAELADFFAAHATAAFAFARVARGDVRPDLPGFTLHEELGRGGIGVVYRATQHRPPREVAVKVLAAGPLAGAVSRERFRREAEAVARLDHPHVAPVYEVGEAGGLPYLVLRLYPGGSLAGRPARYQDDPRAAAELAWQLAGGVAHAHRHGVLHRDLKPANVLLDAAGRPAVCDFGLMAADWADPGLTATRERLGTPHYMAPEQADPALGPATPATDVYGLGGVLYALLTGRPPADGGCLADVLGRVRRLDPPAADRVNPRVPGDLAAICRKCLEKPPARRYPSADALAADLGRFLAGQPTLARPLGRWRAAGRWARRHPAAVAGAAVVWAASAAGGYAWAHAARQASDLRAAAAEARAAAAGKAAADFHADLQRVRARRQDRPPGWAAANRQAVARLAAADAAPAELAALRTELAAALAATDLGQPRQLAAGFSTHPLTFTPDGRTLALGGWRTDGQGRCEVRLVDAAGGDTVRTLTCPADPDWQRRDGRDLHDGLRSVAVSPDGRRLAAGTRSGWVAVWELAAPGDAPAARWRQAPPTADPRHERVDRLEFTPGGRLLVAACGTAVAGWDAAANWAERFRRPWHHDHTLPRRAGPGDPVRFHAGDPVEALEAAPWLRPAAGPVPATRAAGPGWRVTLTAPTHDCLRVVADGADGPGGELRRPDDDGTVDAAVTDAVVTPDGRLAAVAAEHGDHLAVWELAGGRPLAARRPGGGSLRLALAPDGRSLAVAAGSAVLLYPVETGEVCRTAADGPQLADADQAPDGKLVALARAGEGDPPTELACWAGGPAPGWTAGVTKTAGNNRPSVAAGPGGWAAATAGDGVAWVRPGEPPRPIPGATFRNFRDLRADATGRLWAAADDGLRWAGPPPAGGPWALIPAPGKETILCVRPAADVVLTGWDDGRVGRHHPATGELLDTAPVLAAGVTALAAGHGLVVAGGADGSAAVRAGDGGWVRLPPPHADRVTAATVGPGWVATGGRDRAVRLWTPDGAVLLTLPQTRPVRRLFAAADGSALTVLAEGERAVRVWDLAALRRGLAAAGLPPGF